MYFYEFSYDGAVGGWDIVVEGLIYVIFNVKNIKTD